MYVKAEIKINNIKVFKTNTSSFLFGIGFSLLFSKFPNTPFPWYRKVKKSNGSIGHSFYLDQSRLHSGQEFF